MTFRLTFWAAGLLLGANLASTVSATMIDTYDGDLSAYASTVILDNNGAPSNVAAWQIAAGTLQLNTTTRDRTGVEQYAMIYGGLQLNVGYELQVDIVHTGASQDLGLYVGGTAPVAGTRKDYVAMYARNNGQLFSRGFDGTTEYPLAGGATVPYTSLFIARSGVNTYEAGYYAGATRNILTTRTPVFANDADVVGYYADVRAVGVLGSADNLRVVAIPEPATLVLAGLSLVGTLFVRKR
jgi:hypothetical protein